MSPLRTTVLILFGVPLVLALIAGCYLGAVLLFFEVIAPRLHEVRTARADRANDAIWATGDAEVYTVRVGVETRDGQLTRTGELICVRKIETEAGSFKGGPYRWDIPVLFGRREFAVQTPGGFEVAFGTGYPCNDLATIAALGRFPAPLETYRAPSLRRQPGSALDCAPALSADPGVLQPSPFLVVAVRRAPIRGLLTREAYGPADRRLSRSRHPERPESADVAVWRRSGCWQVSVRAAQAKCVPRLENLCAP